MPLPAARGDSNLHQKLAETQKAITADVERNRKLAEASLKIEKTARPLWTEARTVLRGMYKLSEKSAESLRVEKEKMWAKRNATWKVWCDNVYKVAEKEKKKGNDLQLDWFNFFRKHKLTKACK